MSRTEPGWFRCNTGAGRPTEVPWEWSQPRALCASHKVDLELKDGHRLEAVLGRVTPPDNILEGSLLAWIFNPVFVKGDSSQITTAWTDFVGGGILVYEDRFFAKSYFEFRACEYTGAVDLLYALHMAAATGTTVTSTKELIAVAAVAGKAMPHGARGLLRGPIEGWMDLVKVWNFQFNLSRVRSARGRLWPESFMELSDWIEECRSGTEQLQSGTEASFLRELNELALRRFSAIGR